MVFIFITVDKESFKTFPYSRQPQLLFKKIEDDLVIKWRKQFGGSEVRLLHEATNLHLTECVFLQQH